MQQGGRKRLIPLPAGSTEGGEGGKELEEGWGGGGLPSPLMLGRTIGGERQRGDLGGGQGGQGGQGGGLGGLDGGGITVSILPMDPHGHDSGLNMLNGSLVKGPGNDGEGGGGGRKEGRIGKPLSPQDALDPYGIMGVDHYPISLVAMQAAAAAVAGVAGGGKKRPVPIRPTPLAMIGLRGERWKQCLLYPRDARRIVSFNLLAAGNRFNV
jgi:hypothetical protein